MGSFRIKGGIKIRDNIYIRWQTLLCRDLALIVQKAPGMLIVLHCNKLSRQTARKVPYCIRLWAGTQETWSSSWFCQTPWMPLGRSLQLRSQSKRRMQIFPIVCVADRDSQREFTLSYCERAQRSLVQQGPHHSSVLWARRQHRQHLAAKFQLLTKQLGYAEL